MTSEMGRIALITNTRSGRGGVGRSLPAVEEQLKARDLDFEILPTQHRGHATELARDALERGRTLIVAMGGDGTVHEVVNGMIENDRAVNPEAALGVVSTGTGCDFIKTFGIHSDPVSAVRHLEGPDTFTIDLGKVTFTAPDGREVTRIFANIAEAGLGATVVSRAERLPRWLGPTVYLVAFWLTVRKYHAPNVKVDLVDRIYEGRLTNLVVANGQFFGGGMKIAPKAAPTDGLLDVQIQHSTKFEAIAIMPKVFKGQHVPHPDIKEAKRVRTSIESESPLVVEADGEVLGTTPASFEVLRDVIRLKI